MRNNEDVGAPVQSWARQVRWGFAIVLIASLLAACDNGGDGGGGGGGTTNAPPLANAGPAQNVSVGTAVTLDATASTDAEGDALTFRWSLQSRPAGSAAALSNPSTVHPTFTPDMAGDYVVKLVVFDSSLATDEATVTITAATGNSAPVANAGPNQNVTAGATVSLDGSGSSDANGDPITYHWSFTTVPTGSSATLSSATAVNPTFTADLAGSYQVQLVVNDGQVDSTPSTVTITVAAANVAPVANAGPDQNVLVNATVTLDGTGSSDANGDTLTYSWSLTTVPGGSALTTLTGATTAHPTFVPDVAGDYVAQLIVNDGHVNSTGDTVTIHAAVGNVAPVANAGPDHNARVGDTVTLDGSGSSDANVGDTLTYAWTFQSVPVGSALTVLTNATNVHPTFVPDVAGSYVVRLVVNDGHVDSTADTVTITTTVNTVPVANAGAAQNVSVGATVTLDGSASSDADGDTLTYAWTFQTVPGGSALTALTSPTNVHPTFVPDVAGDYVVQLVVNDGRADSTAATVTITAAAGGPTTTTWKPTYVFFTGYIDPAVVDAANVNINFLAQPAPSIVSLPPIRFYSASAGRLRLYDLDLTSYAVNYNGSNLSPTVYTDGGNIPIASIDRWVSMTYTATPSPVTVTMYTTYSSTCTAVGGAQVLILKADGTILKASSACGGTPAAPLATTVTFTDAANAEVIFAFTRGADIGGGIRLWQVDLTK